MSYAAINENQAQQILKEIGARSIEDLFVDIPQQQRLKGLLNLPQAMDDISLQQHLKSLASKNSNTEEFISFLGAGCYDHWVPPVVDTLANQGPFVTAYTPYQAEASQGALQAFYEFQTLICQLTGMDVANASMYEGGSAVAEAVLMARDITMKSKVIVAEHVHPEYIQVLKTYLAALPMKIEILKTENAIDDQTAAVVIQQPDFFGIINPIDKIAKIKNEKNALLIAVVNPISLGMLAPPGKFDVDIVVGEGQPLGIPQNLGGPYLGFMAAKEKYLRRLPGRIIGESVDADGKRAFCLTLQTREQHIRRERATSNICSNEGLLAIRAAIYLSAMGKNGITKLSNLCFQKAHYAAGEISKLENYKLAFDKPFFNEFVVRCKKPVKDILQAAHQQNILAGVDLGRWFPEFNDCLLMAVTEKRTKHEIDQLVKVLDEINI